MAGQSLFSGWLIDFQTMQDETSIINSALDWLGAANIQSIAQTTGNGPKARRAYYQARDTELQKLRWIFSKNQLLLTPITNTWGRYQYAYLYPQDCLKIHWLGAKNDNMPDVTYAPFPVNPMTYFRTQILASHEVVLITDANNQTTGQRAILCNIPQAYLIYTKQIEDTALFPPTFVDILQLEVATRLASVLISDNVTRRTLLERLGQARADAQMFDANEDREWNDNTSPLEDSRY